MTEKFRGRYSIKLDAKGRMAWPTLLRETFGSRTKLVVTNGLYKGQPFLDVYTQKKWEILEEKLDTMSEFRPEVQAYKRFYLASGTPVEIDSQGRILLPYDLRQFAQAKSNIVVVGMGDRIEIWDQSNWNKVFNSFKKDFDSVIASLSVSLDDADKKEKK